MTLLAISHSVAMHFNRMFILCAMHIFLYVFIWCTACWHDEHYAVPRNLNCISDIFPRYPFPQYILNNILESGYAQPTPIQMQAMPILLQVHPVIFSGSIALRKGILKLVKLQSLVTNVVKCEKYGAAKFKNLVFCCLAYGKKPGLAGNWLKLLCVI